MIIAKVEMQIFSSLIIVFVLFCLFHYILIVVYFIKLRKPMSHSKEKSAAKISQFGTLSLFFVQLIIILYNLSLVFACMMVWM